MDTKEIEEIVDNYFKDKKTELNNLFHEVYHEGYMNGCITCNIPPSKASNEVEQMRELALKYFKEHDKDILNLSNDICIIQFKRPK